jgi:hypothetical protein
MWKELFIVILVIAVSYIFTISDRKYYDSQLIFIISALIILVIYKTLYYNTIISSNDKLAKENFTDIDISKVSTWLASSQNNVNTMTLDQQTALIDQYSKIRQDLGNVKSLLQGINAQQVAQATSANESHPTNYDRPSMLNLASYQTIQNERLNNLKAEIAKAKGTLQQVAVAQTAVNYPKIPVYSSCVVADANGGYSSTSTESMAGSVGGGANSANSAAGLAQSGGGVLAQTISGLLSGGVNINLTP